MSAPRVRVLLAAVVGVVVLAAVLVAVTVEGSGPGGDDAPAGPTRDVHRRPFAWDSVWNLPLARSARYEPVATRARDVYLDTENISVDPSFPVRTLRSPISSARVRVDPRLAADGSFNNCSTFLTDSPDGVTIVAGQPLDLRPGGDPFYEYSWGPQPLTGDGRIGCHGGSNLSGIGGSIRIGELASPEPLRHVLKINLNCELSCSPAGGGFRWPAVKADKGFERLYRGSDPRLGMGTLLALAPDADLSRITEPDTRKVAEGLRDYGAYVVDRTGGPSTNALNIQAGAERELPNVDSPQMLEVFRMLHVVTNSSPSTPGGGPLGTARRAPCAPPFADGRGGAPPGC